MQDQFSEPFEVDRMDLTQRRVLVVDDEATVGEVVAAYLDRDGYRVSEAADGKQALEMIDAERPDLIVLDVMLPGNDGLNILATVRRTMTTPVILLTARADEADRIVGLEMGADDYVIKPFSPRELAARVKAVLKRAAEPQVASAELLFDGLSIDGRTRDVTVEGTPVELTPREFDLLHFLASSPRRVFSRAQILNRVWGSSPDWQDPATVTVHVGRVRQKIEVDASDPRWVTTVWGVGYRFEP